MKRRDVRAVFFDAGYTLLCMNPDQETLFLQTCRNLNVAIDQAKLANGVAIANAMLRPRPAKAMPTPFSQASVDDFWIAYHRELLGVCAARPADIGRAESIYRAFTAALDWRVYDEVRPLLASIRERGLMLGVVSNWTGDLDDVLERVGLRDSFDFVLDSARIGFEKPHPDIFREALGRASCAAVDALHVGDSPEHDVDGALACGLRAVLLDRNDRHTTFDRAPRVRSLAGVVEYL
ncbi:MAG TPA: HAD-IA family hydrolase [Candidatus Eremiobacteraceae bacterium]|jgi:REG-2-like HAD superfamily hydrolase